MRVAGVGPTGAGLAWIPPAVLALIAALPGQEAEPEAGLVAMHQAALDASNATVVLNIAAHPDDESSRTNTMLRRKHGMRVVTAYTTFGDGGQNAIGRAIGVELARLRVGETQRAAAMGDVEVRWLGMPDFGFSKTLDETLRIWGRDELVAAMREVVDSVDPDVVITNHSLDRGHGHHRASFWAIVEVLKERAAAGRPAPLLYNRCGFQQAQLTFDPNELDPARGETYARLAHRAWTQHVTQGPWGPHDPLRVGRDFWCVAWPPGAAAADPQRWSGERLPAAPAASAPRAELRAALEAARRELQAVAADLSQPGAVRRARILHRRQEALQRLLLAAIGVRAEVWLDDDRVPLGGTGTGYVVLHGADRVERLRVRCGGDDAEPVQVAPRATPFDGLAAAPAGSGSPAAPAAGDLPPPDPGAAASGRFRWTFPADIGFGEEPPDGPEPVFVEVEIAFDVDGLPVELLRSLPYTPVAPIDLNWDREVLLVAAGQRTERLLSVAVRSNRTQAASAGVRLQTGPGILATATPVRLALSRDNPEARVLVRATIEAEELTPDARLAIGFFDSTAPLRVVAVDVSVPPGLKVGLVRGPDDTTEQVLADLGVDCTPLGPDALVTTRLEQFTALLLDIRAYHHRPELAEVRERLLQYCRSGGRVVAMYHKPNEWNERAGRPLLAPFPMVIGDDRVTEEDSPVVLLQPGHRLLQHPHAIGADDFVGWVQERGLNFPKSWDPAWTPLLSLRDSSDEKAHEGALLHTQYGRGDFVYCSLALYRQLRVGNPGAARLLVNLLAK